MTDSKEDRARFAALITALCDYYDKTASKGVISLYWEGLKQYDYEGIEKAAWAHTQSPDENGRWMPKISDLNKVLQGSTKDQAAIAWSKVDKAVRCVGTYADVAFDDALVHRVIEDMGGWVQLGTKSTEEWPFVAKEFETRYRGYKMRDESPAYPRWMIGIASAQNNSAGMRSPDGIRLIGNEQKAIAVIEGGSKDSGLRITDAKQEMLRIAQA